jgi:NADH:ubiquinone oxidoreductase subunit 5 (subunit L)/multisubunit Na+/H+ antiporter MnhA subunit
LLIHLYGYYYIYEDPLGDRFLILIGFFAFSMYLLVCANNFIFLFIG